MWTGYPLTQSQACGLIPFFFAPSIQKEEEPEILPLPMAGSLLATLRTGDKKKETKRPGSLTYKEMFGSVHCIGR